MSFADLLAKREAAKATLSARIEKLSTNNNSYDKTPDARFWTGTTHLKNADGNGRATIRFLPAPEGEDEAFVLFYSYFHKHQPEGAAKAKYYVEKSLKTFGNDEKDPAYDFNGSIYGNAALSDDEKKKRSIRRQKKFVSNILVIDDPVQPENNGKVFLFEYGPEIFKIIEARMKPDPAVSDDEPANPFDPIDGCNFKLRIVSKKIPGVDKPVPSYASSTWSDVGPLAETVEEMESIWKKAYALKAEFLDRTKFASYEDQLKNFKRVFGFVPGGIEADPLPSQESKEAKSKALKDDLDDDLPDFAKGSSPKDDLKDEEEDDGKPPFNLDDEDEDDDFFNKFKK